MVILQRYTFTYEKCIELAIGLVFSKDLRDKNIIRLRAYLIRLKTVLNISPLHKTNHSVHNSVHIVAFKQ